MLALLLFAQATLALGDSRADPGTERERTAAFSMSLSGAEIKADVQGRFWYLRVPSSRPEQVLGREKPWSGGAKGLRLLRDLPHLREVHIYAEGLSIEDARALSRLATLDTLTIGTPDFTDQLAIEVLRSPSLTRLILSSPKLSDQCLATDAFPPNLNSLSIGSRELTGSTLKNLARCPRLTTLSLDGSGLDDAGVRELARLEQVRVAVLANTRITDKSLEHLASMRRLSRLAVMGTRTTPEGIAAFTERTRERVRVNR
jgi:hypothetical protein